jgi:hypothetical protein
MYPYAGKNADEVAAGFQYNLKRNMNGDGAPFGIFLHTAWLSDNSTGLVNATLVGLRKFLSELPKGTVVLTPSQVINLMKKSGETGNVSLPTYKPRPLARCGFMDATYCKGGRPTLWGSTCEYWWTCNASCPTSFPWLDNVQGAKAEKGCYGITADDEERQQRHREADYDPFRR